MLKNRIRIVYNYFFDSESRYKQKFILKEDFMKKKTLALIMAVGMAFSLMTACGGADATDKKQEEKVEKEEKKEEKAEEKEEKKEEAAADDFVFDKKIEIICPWGVGGGFDTTLRALQPQLEEVIGQPVVINNVSGAGGVNGVQYATQQPADGYTFLGCTLSPVLAQITGATDFDVYANVTPVSRMVWDTNMFVTGKDSPFNNYEELMKYIEENPGSVQCGVMSLTGLDAACIKGTFGDKIEAVGYSDGSQLNSDLIGGHVGLGVVGPAEIESMIESGDMKPILVCAEERLTMDDFKDVECTGELGIDCYYGPYRCIFAANGTPKEAIKALDKAVEEATQSEDFQNWKKAQGLDQRPGYLNTEDLQKQWDSDYKELNEMFGSK